MATDNYNIFIQSEDRTISAEPDQTLLEALVGGGVLLRADCGGRGRCGKCKWLDICNGNFRVRAEAISGDVWGEEPACYLTDEEIGL